MQTGHFALAQEAEHCCVEQMHLGVFTHTFRRRHFCVLDSTDEAEQDTHSDAWHMLFLP